MDKSERSPVLFPFVIVHIGVFGIISSFFVAIQRDVLVRSIGIAGLASSVFPIIAGLCVIGQYRRKPAYFDDANYALKALSIFILPALTYILSITIILVIYSFSGNTIIFLVLFIQYFIQRSVNFYEELLPIFEMPRTDCIKMDPAYSHDHCESRVDLYPRQSAS